MSGAAYASAVIKGRGGDDNKRHVSAQATEDWQLNMKVVLGSCCWGEEQRLQLLPSI